MTEITGYARPDGKFGIRNHVLVLATVSCVTGVVQRRDRLAVVSGHRLKCRDCSKHHGDVVARVKDHDVRSHGQKLPRRAVRSRRFNPTLRAVPGR